MRTEVLRVTDVLVSFIMVPGYSGHTSVQGLGMDWAKQEVREQKEEAKIRF